MNTWMRDVAICVGIAFFAWFVSDDPSILYDFGGGICLALCVWGIVIVINDIVRYLNRRNTPS